VSSNQAAAARRPGRSRVPDWEPTRPPLERQIRILRDDWLEVLAGDNPHLRNPVTGKPRTTTISAAAGLDRTSLTRIENGQNGLTLAIADALVRFLREYRGFSADEADTALFERVTTEAVPA
jgi:hypothetical protein